MTDHYYSKKPSVKSEKKQIVENVMGISFRFSVDHGVFAKTGLDFGTRLLIESFEDPAIDGDIADVGCGWGPIGIYLAKSIPTRMIHMVDINERSILLTKENIELNKTENTIVFQNNLLEGFEKESLAVVITNPPIRAGKETVFSLYKQAKNALKKNGELWVVIQKKQGALSTKKNLEELGFDVKVKNKAKGYNIFRGKLID